MVLKPPLLKREKGRMPPLPNRKTLGGPPCALRQKAGACSPLRVYGIKAQPAGNWWHQIPACTDVVLFERLSLSLLGTSMLTIEGNQALVALATKQQQAATALPVAPRQGRHPCG
ncbi:hypothetical protein DSO57_1006848 [Entomophthora muscae]|uniref:Uncharacterized protein n=1 Tax=Entomophthora muscae TaxID=34485 RepID=A0ACC2SKI0_9FUNG|nr:hypothetical protein DSO57_1006848 [Entomophthora muscae]